MRTAIAILAIPGSVAVIFTLFTLGFQIREQRKWRKIERLPEAPGDCFPIFGAARRGEGQAATEQTQTGEVTQHRGGGL